MSIFARGIMGSRSRLSMFSDKEILDYVEEHGLLGAYVDIEPLSPDFFAQLRYAVYAGEQVLFQDAACTVPVTEPGNHVIGGVKDPFTGAIVLTQTDAAKKPLWMGEAVGAYFDGIDDHLGMGSTFFTDEASIFVSISNIINSGVFTDGGGTSKFLFKSYTNGSRILCQIDHSVDGIKGHYITTGGTSGVVGAKIHANETSEVIAIDGSKPGSEAGAFMGPGDGTMVLGARINGTKTIEGNIAWVAGFARDTSNSEGSILRSNP